MEYTVKEMAKLSGVTIKTLHHYHKIGLLVPCRITDAGYRIYGKTSWNVCKRYYSIVNWISPSETLVKLLKMNRVE
ncbi:MerR-like DNA binding protein [Mobilisporobacter senegalensis]|uniref:MerR-like DNA binding protein n=1 Tax=Mobilisporobacter senegalensis TaxID=1329262 RepID=A0A3N1XQV0_9FIRM|nr:MerR-like DNA binding protein [Mobilisporobacter senegalensis]